MDLGNTPALVTAVRDNDLVSAERLLRSGADPNAKDVAGYPQVLAAAGRGNVQMVELLLTAGADPNLLESRTGASPLHKAAQGGVVDAARLLVERGAFLDLQSPTQGHTPLMEAVWNKRLAVTQYLLAAGADPTLRAHLGYTALDLAERDGLDELAAFLRAALAAREHREHSPLRQAALSGDVAGVRRALADGADVDEKAPDGHTPLLDAAREGHTDVVRELLTWEANPRIVDALMKATPAHKAGYRGHAAVARLLVEHGVELDAQGPYNGYTALHDAVWHGHLEAARVFIEAGARLDLRALDGRTPQDMARDYGYVELARMLAEAEARASGVQR